MKNKNNKHHTAKTVPKSFEKNRRNSQNRYPNTIHDRSLSLPTTIHDRSLSLPTLYMTAHSHSQHYTWPLTLTRLGTDILIIIEKKKTECILGRDYKVFP